MKKLISILLIVASSNLLNAQTESEFKLQVQITDTNGKYGDRDVGISPDGSFFYTFMGEENVLRIWKTSTGRLLRTLRGFPQYPSFKIERNNRFIQYSDKEVLYRIEVSSGKISEIKLPWNQGTSPDYRYFLKRMYTGNMEVYAVDAPTQKLWEFPEEGQYHFSSDGQIMVQWGDKNKYIKTYDVATGKLLYTISKKSLPSDNEKFDKDYYPTYSKGWIISKDKKWLMWCNKYLVKINLETGEHQTREDVKEFGSLTDNGGFVDFYISHNKESVVNYTNIENPDKSVHINNIMDQAVGGKNWVVRSIDISADDKYIVAAGYGLKSGIYVIDLEKKKLIRELDGIDNKLNRISITDDNLKFVVGGEHNATRIWSLKSGRVEKTFNIPGVSSSLISGDGNTALCQAIHSTRVWDRNSYEYKKETTFYSGIWSMTSGKKIKDMPYFHNPQRTVDGRNFYGNMEYENKYSYIRSKLNAKVAFDKLEIEYLYPREYNSNEGFDVKYKTPGFGKKKFQNTAFYGGEDYFSGISPSGDMIWIYGGWRIQSQYGSRPVYDGPNGLRITSGKELFINTELEDVKSMAFSNDGSVVVAVKDDYSRSGLLVLDSKTGMEQRRLKDGQSGMNNVVFSADDSKLLLSHEAGLEIIDFTNGNIEQSFDAGEFNVKHAVFVNYETQVLSVGGDQIIRLWDVKSGDQIMSFIPAGNHDFATVTPDYYYSASKGVGQYLHFVKDMQTYNFDNFDLALNRPDIIAERLGKASPLQIAAYKNAYLKRLKKMGFTEDQISNERHLPKVEILTEGIPYETEQRQFAFKIKGSDSKYNLDRVNVYVNGVPINGIKGSSVKKLKARTIEMAMQIELSTGDNQVEVSVHNEKGAESIKESFSIVCSQERPSNTYVVSIGISDYQNDEFDLNYAAKDASDIAIKFGTDASRVFSITDGNAVKEKILAIKSELMKSTVDDRVILFVAGHGLLDENLDYYIGMHDVDFENPAARGLPYEQLEGLLDGIPARKKLMFIDACHSGEVDKDDAVLVASNETNAGTISARGFKTVASKSNSLGLENSFQLMQELFADLRKGTGAVVISSASGAEFALESDAWKNGVFTYSILEGLENRKCDADKDGAVQVSELKDYVFTRVAELTNGKQHPTSRRENLEHDFVVW